MKIGVVVDNEYTNDIRVTNECKILSQNGHQVHVLCFNFGSYIDDYTKTEGITIHRIKINKKVKNILFALTNTFDIYSHWWAKKIKLFVKKNKIEALHVHDLYLSKASHLVVKNIEDLIYTLDLHENYAYAVDNYQWMHKPFTKMIIKPNAWKRKEKKYLEYANNIVVLSDDFKNDLLTRYPKLKEKQFAIYPNVPDINQLLAFKVDPNIINLMDNYTLFYFGAVSIRRGFDLLLDSIESISIKIPELKLLVIGPIDKAEKKWFNEKFKNPKIKDYLIYFPWKDISTLPSFIKLSDICLSPLHKNPQHESGIANKVFQYMLFEKPILVSNCKPQETLINKYNCGLSYIWNSRDDFIEKVLYMYNNRGLVSQMGKAGRKAILEELNGNIISNQLANLY